MLVGCLLVVRLSRSVERKGWKGVFMVPIDRELLSLSLISEGQMSLPSEAYTDVAELV